MEYLSILSWLQFFVLFNFNWNDSPYCCQHVAYSHVKFRPFASSRSHGHVVSARASWSLNLHGSTVKPRHLVVSRGPCSSRKRFGSGHSGGAGTESKKRAEEIEIPTLLRDKKWQQFLAPIFFILFSFIFQDFTEYWRLHFIKRGA